MDNGQRRCGAAYVTSASPGPRTWGPGSCAREL